MCPTSSSRTLALDSLRYGQLGPVLRRTRPRPLRHVRQRQVQRQDVSAIPPGSTIPAIDLNGNMQGDQPDRYNNSLPVRWVLYKGQTGEQPIISAIDSVNTYQGNPTVLLTGSGRTSRDDNPPALESRPCTWPVISEGQSYTFSCALKATGAYGSGVSPSLQISWYDSFGSYISSTNGSTLTLTGSFARYSLSGTAPTAAAYARLFVRVGYNAGSIWVGGATWTGVGGTHKGDPCQEGVRDLPDGFAQCRQAGF